jgi:hypothetical protein
MTEPDALAKLKKLAAQKYYGACWREPDCPQQWPDKPENWCSQCVIYVLAGLEAAPQQQKDQDDDQARVEPLTARIDGQDLPQSDNELKTDALRKAAAHVRKWQQNYVVPEWILPLLEAAEALIASSPGVVPRPQPQKVEEKEQHEMPLTRREGTGNPSGDPPQSDNEPNVNDAERTERIKTRCPSCGFDTLFIGSGGWLVCSWLECKNPGAINHVADQLFESRSPDGDGPYPLQGIASSADQNNAQRASAPEGQFLPPVGSSGKNATAGSEPADSHHRIATAVRNIRFWLVQSFRYTASTIELDEVLTREITAVLPSLSSPGVVPSPPPQNVEMPDDDQAGIEIPWPEGLTVKAAIVAWADAQKEPL